MDNNWQKEIEKHYNYAKKYLNGGISSCFRLNRFNKLPMYLSKADGAYCYDITGKKYIDFFMGHSAALLGHNRPEVKKAMSEMLEGGFFSAYDSDLNFELAKLITEIIPCAERVLSTNSGSESTQLAMRFARGYTGKEKIIRIDGHFHGVNDYALFNNLNTHIDQDNPGGRPSAKKNYYSKGIPKAVGDTVILIPWNDVEAFSEAIRLEGENIAGIMMNPMDFNNGCITTTKEYLTKINEIAHKNGIVVIYDEILSGFRTGVSCAQGYYGVTPDICTLGKAISNGVPISMVAGKKDIMDLMLDPEQPVIHGGTFSGNRLGTAASIASINVMMQDNFYPDMLKVGEYFFTGIQKLFDDHNIPTQVQSLGSAFFPYIGLTEPVTNYKQFKDINWDFTNKFFSNCIDEGLYFHTDLGISAAHTIEDIDITLEKMNSILGRMKY